MEETKPTVQQILDMSSDDLRVEVAKLKGWKFGKLYTKNHQLVNDKCVLSPDYFPSDYIFEETEWDARVLNYEFSFSCYRDWLEDKGAALELLQEIPKQDSQKEVNYFVNIHVRDTDFLISINSFRREERGIYDERMRIYIEDKDFCIAVCRTYVIWKHDLRTEETWMEKEVRKDKEKELLESKED